MRIDLFAKYWFNIFCVLVLFSFSHLALSNISLSIGANSTIPPVILPEFFCDSGGPECGVYESPLPGECAIIFSPSEYSYNYTYNYSLSDNNYSGLSIDSSSGYVTLCPDEQMFEQYPQISFTILVTDSAGNMSELLATYSLPNYDTTPPNITSGHIVYLEEHELYYNESFTAQIYAATVNNESAPVHYSLTSQFQEVFNIDPHNGIVTFNYDHTQHQYLWGSEVSFALTATDSSGNASFKEVQVYIGAQPCPAVLPPIITIYEHNGINQVVYTPYSNGTAGDVTYSLALGSSSELSIDRITGVVTLAEIPEGGDYLYFNILLTDVNGFTWSNNYCGILYPWIEFIFSPPTVSVTFQLNMAGVDTTNGVSVMGGAVFGQAGIAMTDDDGDDIWTVMTPLEANSTVMFKYRNTTAVTWDNLENPAGLIAGGCANGQWNDRLVTTAEADIVLPVVDFGSCTSTPMVDVTFQVNMAGVDASNGVSVMGGAVFGQAGIAMTDDDGDDIWTVTTPLEANSTVMFKYRNTTAVTWDNLENPAGLIAGGCANGQWNDRLVTTAEADIELPAVAFGSCTSTPMVDVTFQVNMAGVDTTNGVSVMGGAVFGLAGIAMTDDDGDDIWTVTTPLEANSTVMFKYRNTTAATWDNQESVPADCANGEWGDRRVNPGTEDAVLNITPYGGCYYQQIISVSNAPKGILGKTTVLDIAYDTNHNNNQLPGIGMRLHFNSNILNFKEITNLIEQDIIVNGQGPFNDDGDFDNDPLTDQYISFGWASLFGNWPNLDLPTLLMNIAFDVSDTIDKNITTETSINFSHTALAAGYHFESESYKLELQPASWDFDGNGQADALTDGLMMLRYCFGLRGESVTATAVATDSSMSPEQVVHEIESAMEIADIDNDGEVEALTDGLMLLRYLFGLRGNSITAAAVSPNANRSTNEAVEAYLEAYMPAM